MRRMTTACALVEALIAEGIEIVFGVLGHGNVQLGQALREAGSRIRFIPAKNEQAAVHAALAWARLKGTPLAVTTSVGPGATNLVTGAACARVNRLPVLLLPGEVFAEGVGPVLQQLESRDGTTANDALRPVSKYWARLQRPEQLRQVLREAFDAMLEPGDEGPATLCLPMDVQAEALDIDERWLCAPPRRRPHRHVADADAVEAAAGVLLGAERPLVIAGGGVVRSGAQDELRALAETLWMPVAQTQAGKGCFTWEHPLNVFAVGTTGSRVGNALAGRADVVLGVGTRYTDFTTASETAFAADARFVNVNTCWADVGKERGFKLWGDAGATLAALRGAALAQLEAPGARARIHERREGAIGREWRALRDAWIAETDGWRNKPGSPLRQSVAIRVINDFVDERSIILSAAGSLPGDLQKLWRDKSDDGLGYVCEYGYSTMGFEIAGGLGAKLAHPERQTVVLVGDMSFLMSSQELVTAVEQRVSYTVVVFANGGGQSIRSLQRSRGFGELGMELRAVDGARVHVDFAQVAEGLGCRGLRAVDAASLEQALQQTRGELSRPTVIHLEVDPDDRIGDTGGWWDVPVAAVDGEGAPRPERREYLDAKRKQVLR
jgi:3D-(3,5/4)-trihydroxycyclohexane-1,2-dione acylhydrolase (decyclizing)